MRNATVVLILFLPSSVSFAVDRVATVSGSNAKIPFLTSGESVLIDVSETAKAFKWRLKIVRPGKLITFCRDSGCVPVVLTTVKSETVGNRLFVEATAIGKALSFSVQMNKGRVRLIKLVAAKNKSDGLPAYNAKWGKGRGFRVGQTLPDIPLFDLRGNEVRFSKFLGKQYIVYCWASW